MTRAIILRETLAAIVLGPVLIAGVIVSAYLAFVMAAFFFYYLPWGLFVLFTQVPLQTFGVISVVAFLYVFCWALPMGDFGNS